MLLALVELVGVVALMLAAGALVCRWLGEVQVVRCRKRKRKRETCPAVVVNGRKR